MENQSKHTVSNFWFGFMLGTAIAGCGAFLFGTKKGRKTLQRLLELSENMEENILLLTEELGEEIKEKTEEIYSEIEKPKKKSSSTIGFLLNKIKTLSPQNSSSQKRFFIKK